MIDQPKQVLPAELSTILKNRIVRWEYPPGYRLTEDEIGKEFGVSRSPVRETLRMLEEQGLVEKVPHRGCTVKQPDVQAFNELYDVRLILELAAVERLTQKGGAADLLAELACVWNRLAGARNWEEVAMADLAQADRVFHETLAAAAGNQTLLDMLRTINDRLHFMRMIDITTVDRLWATCEQHLRVVEAIASGDVAGARQALHVNIEGARAHVKNAIKEALVRSYQLHSER